MTRPPADILLRIVRQRRERLGALKGASGDTMPPPAAEVSAGTAANPLLLALESSRGRAVIAEIKMGSPRLGSLQDRVDAVRQARLYAEHGAAALSVVVEPDFFYGSYELLARCREASGLPALAKDFVVDRRQLAWARQAGAAAVLLIAALYEAAELERWAGEARDLGLVPLVETHERADLIKLGQGRWELVGVNNRDLRTFEVSFERSLELAGELPSGALKVSESGISRPEQVQRLADAGFDAFLVGESLLLSSDPAAQLRRLVA